MRVRLPIVLFAFLALVQTSFLLPAAADSAIDRPHATAQRQTAAPQACPIDARGINLAQLAQTECCKGKKGICGCRAGKIVCCDGSASTHPGCTCHGDEGVGN